jgi:tetratricopeptide (TPR) repeat protein
VTIHAVDGDNPRPYLVMQYVAGLSLQQRLDRDGPLRLHEILRIGMQTAAGLAAAHAQGLVHRDIKPANILLENGVERVKITDFGLARVANEASLTQSGVVAGTPHYMSPEQAEGKPLDQRTDRFSLGSVLYAMCTGRAPFRADGTMAVLKRVCEETPTPIRETNPDIPDWLVAIIDKLHAKNPAERFQSAAEVADLLSQHLAHVQHPSVAPLPIGVARVEQREGRVGPGKPDTPFADSARATRRRRWAVAAAVLLLMLGGFSLTEATGVTSLRATVIRILTPEGTLVVETNDPAVKVTVEGDGDLVITGAGAQEVRLRPGSYKLRATKDGKPVPLDQELVTITRGDKHVVRVAVETKGLAEPGRPSLLLNAKRPRAFLEVEEALRDAVRLKPGDAKARFALGSFHAEWGEWKEAAAAYDRGLELDPTDHFRWMQAAVLHAADGDLDGYRRACRQMFDRCRDTDDTLVAERTARACLLIPNTMTGADFDRVQELARLAATGTEQNIFYRFLVRTMARADYRAGRYAEAGKWLEQAAPKMNGNHEDASMFAILSMALHSLRRTEEAAAALARAKSIMTKLPDSAPGRPFGNDWLFPVIAWLECREAELLLKKK